MNPKPNKSDPCRFGPRDRPLVFSPQAWLKLLFFLYAGETEVGGFGITDEHDPLYVQDFVTVAQRTGTAHVEFDDAAVADYFDRCVDQGLKPERFGRLWIHTHPCRSAQPSLTDEQTFDRVFGGCDWAVMFILSRSQAIYARMRFGAGPGGHMTLNVVVDWGAWPHAVAANPESWSPSLASWAQEYRQNVHAMLSPAFDPDLAVPQHPEAGEYSETEEPDGWRDLEDYELGFGQPLWGRPSFVNAREELP